MLLTIALLIAAEPVEVNVRLHQTITIPKQTGQKARFWIPLPIDSDGQTVTELLVPKPFSVTRDPATGNRFAFVEFAPEQLPETVVIECAIRRNAFDPLAAKPYWQPPKETLKSWLVRDAKSKDPKIDEVAKKLVEGVDDPLEKGRRIYDHVFASMTYDKSAPGWGLGDAKRACEIGKGNCTDFHSLFVALCQAAGIPARLEMGMNLPVDGNGYHCWASFHAGAYGWIPVDISQSKTRLADKASPTEEERRAGFGRLDANRVSYGRGIERVLAPAATTTVRFVFEPVLEVDGKRIAGLSSKWQSQPIKE